MVMQQRCGYKQILGVKQLRHVILIEFKLTGKLIGTYMDAPHLSSK
jgi:hypothetical protein